MTIPVDESTQLLKRIEASHGDTVTIIVQGEHDGVVCLECVTGKLSDTLCRDMLGQPLMCFDIVASMGLPGVADTPQNRGCYNAYHVILDVAFDGPNVKAPLVILSGAPIPAEANKLRLIARGVRIT